MVKTTVLGLLLKEILAFKICKNSGWQRRYWADIFSVQFELQFSKLRCTIQKVLNNSFSNSLLGQQFNEVAKKIFIACGFVRFRRNFDMMKLDYWGIDVSSTDEGLLWSHRFSWTFLSMRELGGSRESYSPLREKKKNQEKLVGPR